MKGLLLDTNVLVALLWPTHAQHQAAARWFTKHRAKRWATCALTEAGFVRVVSNPAFSRDAVTPREAAELLAANLAAPDHDFWACDLSFGSAVAASGPRLVGHQQVTDAYLLGLARKHRGMLATLDHKIAALTVAGSDERKALELID